MREATWAEWKFLRRAAYQYEWHYAYSMGFVVTIDGRDVAFASDGQRLHLIWDVKFPQKEIRGCRVIDFFNYEVWSSETEDWYQRIPNAVKSVMVKSDEDTLVFKTHAYDLRHSLRSNTEKFSQLIFTPNHEVYLYLRRQKAVRKLRVDYVQGHLDRNYTLDFSRRFVREALPKHKDELFTLSTSGVGYPFRIGEWGKRLAIIMPASFPPATQLFEPDSVKAIGGWGFYLTDAKPSVDEDE